MSYGMSSPMLGPNGKTGNKVPKGVGVGQIQNFNPEQQKLFSQLFGDVGPESYLSKLAGGDQGVANQIEAPAMQQFSELQGGLASRFSGAGGGFGARKSSGFQNEAGQQASNFALQLQGQRNNLQQQAIKDLHGMSHSLLNQRPYEQFTYDKPDKSSGWGGLIGAGIGGVGGFFAGGPAGALQGAQLGYGVGSQF